MPRSWEKHKFISKTEKAGISLSFCGREIPNDHIVQTNEEVTCSGCMNIMKKIKIHYSADHIYENLRIMSACGRSITTSYVTKDISKVSCSHCLKLLNTKYTDTTINSDTSLVSTPPAFSNRIHTTLTTKETPIVIREPTETLRTYTLETAEESITIPVEVMIEVCKYILSKHPKEKTPLLHRKKLRKLRAEKGLTQLDLSKLTGISREHIGRIERKQMKISQKNAKKLSKVLKISTKELLSEEDTDKAKPPNLNPYGYRVLTKNTQTGEEDADIRKMEP